MTPPGSRCPAAPRRLQTGEGRRWPLRRGPRARPGELLPGHGGGGRGGSAVEAASPGAGRPRHHHRLGGSSATLLLNKVISSRCTMGTSRMTSVRPSWSRGKMTTLSAGRSAWKLNQRRSRQQAGGAPPPGCGPRRLPDSQADAETAPRAGRGAADGGSPAPVGARRRTRWVPGRGWRPRAASRLCGRKAACGNSPRVAVGGCGGHPGTCRTQDGAHRGWREGTGPNPQATGHSGGLRTPGQARQQLRQARKARRPPGAGSHRLNT